MRGKRRSPEGGHLTESSYHEGTGRALPGERVVVSKDTGPGKDKIKGVKGYK